jgi:DNA-binding MarR family transcriptional regulator
MDNETPQHVDVQVVAMEIFELTRQIWLSAQRRRDSNGMPDLSETEFLTLDALEQDGGMTVGDLQRRVEVLPAQMSRIIRNLESRYDEPLVSCALNPEDKRKINVSLTSAGRQAAEQFRRAKIELTAQSLRSLSGDDIRHLLRIVRQVAHEFRR